MLQTVPALALLVFMIPLLGIGTAPALVALCLYALLPIVRNTYAGLISIDRSPARSPGCCGLGRRRRVLRIELPLSSIAIMAGIKTSAVMTVGTATLAAFIGGGGYGTLIVRGLALDDIGTILAGALPAAAMAACSRRSSSWWTARSSREVCGERWAGDGRPSGAGWRRVPFRLDTGTCALGTPLGASQTHRAIAFRAASPRSAGDLPNARGLVRRPPSQSSSAFRRRQRSRTWPS